MNSIKVRNLDIGAGIPKICVPIVGTDRTAILDAAKRIPGSAADLAEWRADWYEDILDEQKTGEILKELRMILGDMPILFTFRTAGEGGEKEIDPVHYIELNRQAAASGCADLVDVELFTGDDAVRTVIDAAHSHGVKVIASNHDFHATPSKEEIIIRLIKMQELGADILKIAVMPQNSRDVLTLLSATEEMTRLYAECPLISMSMGGVGLISRLCGETFGSAVTFGAVGKISAPGQIGAEELAQVLELLHKNR